jgi:hypothetical protein
MNLEPQKTNSISDAFWYAIKHAVLRIGTCTSPEQLLAIVLLLNFSEPVNVDFIVIGPQNLHSFLVRRIEIIIERYVFNDTKFRVFVSDEALIKEDSFVNDCIYDGVEEQALWPYAIWDPHYLGKGFLCMVNTTSVFKFFFQWHFFSTKTKF